MNPVSIPKDYVITSLSKLEKEVQAIQHFLPLKGSLELHNSVENLCKLNYARNLYDRLCVLTNNHVKNCLLPAVLRKIDFLGNMSFTWATFCCQTIQIRNLFLYLDRTFVLRSDQPLMSISAMLHNSFKRNIVLNPIVRSKLIQELLYFIGLERKGKIINRNLIKFLLDMLRTLQVYENIFEVPFLTRSKLMYKIEGETLINEYDTIQYLKHVEKRCSEEKERVNNYLSISTEKPLIDVLVNQLISPHLKNILHNGVNLLIENFYFEELSFLYKRLYFLPDGSEEVCQAFEDYLKKRGLLIVINPENDKNMIQELVEFKDKIDKIVSDCFENDYRYINAVKNAFNSFINQRPNKPAELLAKFVDLKLRCKDLRKKDIPILLDKVIVLFRLIEGKDVFEAFYRRNLAKRLLIEKSACRRSEMSMIFRLKEECGSGFTSKMEGMFKDMTISQSISDGFRFYLSFINSVGDGLNHITIDMSVNVLTGSCWPNYLSYDVTLPSEMVMHQNTFSSFYLKCYSKRKLYWQPDLGYCIIKANFSNGKKELEVSLFQTIVILLFNGAAELSYKDIFEATNLEHNELKRTLQSLACGKARILLKVPKGKDVDESDNFMVNNDFTDQLFRVKMNEVQMKETVEEQRATEKSINQDRQFQIDAAIVRIMKLKKTLSHNALISELYNILDIPIKPADLKKRIEQLIDRAYIERDKNDHTIYKYIA